MTRLRSFGRAGDDRGMSTVLFALMLPVILGMQALTVDATRVFVRRGELQNAVDAASLAAATYLPTTDPARLATARAVAVEYAALNGVTITEDDVTFSTEGAPFDRVRVRAETDVVFAFARAVGISLAAVGSQGAAQSGQLARMASVLPWGVARPAGGFAFGDAYCLKLGGTGSGGTCASAIPISFYALDLDATGGGGAVYRSRIDSGSLTAVAVADTRSAIAGDMKGPTHQGLDDRLAGDTTAFSSVIEALEDGGYRVLNWASPRVAIVPVVDYAAPTAAVAGFAVFYIESYSADGAVVGRFIDTAVPGGLWAPLSGTAFGAHVVRLME